MRKIFALTVLLCLLLCGCRDAASEPVRETAAPTVPVHIVTPAPTEANEHILAQGTGDGTVVEQGYEAEYSWQVKSWTIYESWAAAGVSMESLFQDRLDETLLAEPGGGMLLVTLAFTNEKVVLGDGELWTYATNFWPVSDQKLEAASAAEVLDQESLIHHNAYFAESGEVLIDGRVWDTAFKLPQQGQSRDLTLGWTLTAEQVTAAQNGELSLWLDSDPKPEDVFGLALLPLIVE